MLPADSLMIVMKKDKRERFISERQAARINFNTVKEVIRILERLKL